GGLRPPAPLPELGERSAQHERVHLGLVAGSRHRPTSSMSRRASIGRSLLYALCCTSTSETEKVTSAAVPKAPTRLWTTSHQSLEEARRVCRAAFRVRVIPSSTSS